jgi:hypothetical protein
MMLFTYRRSVRVFSAFSVSTTRSPGLKPAATSARFQSEALFLSLRRGERPPGVVTALTRTNSRVGLFSICIKPYTQIAVVSIFFPWPSFARPCRNSSSQFSTPPRPCSRCLGPGSRLLTPHMPRQRRAAEG